MTVGSASRPRLAVPIIMMIWIALVRVFEFTAPHQFHSMTSLPESEEQWLEQLEKLYGVDHNNVQPTEEDVTSVRLSPAVVEFIRDQGEVGSL